MTMSKFLVNLKQASVAKDHKARIHTLHDLQPEKCQIDEITQYKDFVTIEEAIRYCNQSGIGYKMCPYCC